MTIGEKKTKLNDEAALYRHETDDLTEKEKFSRMTTKQKWIHFKTYYLFKIVVGLVCAGFLISLIVTVTRPTKEKVLYAAVSDSILLLDDADVLEQEFGEYIGIDPETQEIFCDVDFFFDGTSAYDSYQKLTVLFAVGDISVVIVPESIFSEMAFNGYFIPISEILPTDLYTRLLSEGRLVESEIRDDNNGVVPASLKAYGIACQDTEYFNRNFTERPVMGICACVDDYDTMASFVKFIFK